MLRIWICLLIFFCIGNPVPYAAESSPEPRRTEQGYEVTKDNFLNIPSDMKVHKVAGNVITSEPDIDYLARKLEEQNQRIAQLEARIQELEKRFNS